MVIAAPMLDDRPPLDDAPLRRTIRRAHRANEAACLEALLTEAAVEPEPRARHRGPRPSPGGAGPRGRRRSARGRGVPARIQPQHARRHHADVPGRGAAADPGRRDQRPADPRQAQRRRLGAAARAERIAVRQRLDLGPDADRPAGPGDRSRAASSATRFGRLVARLGEPVVRQAIRQAMRVLGRQFVLGQTIEARRSGARRELEQQGFRYSYDMLGEGAQDHGRCRGAISWPTGTRSRRSARPRAGDDLMAAAQHLDQALGAASALRAGRSTAGSRPSCCRACSSLLAAARAGRITVTIDAEESRPPGAIARSVRARWRRHPGSAGWDGLGLAVQAYQKRALPRDRVARGPGAPHRRRIPVRLVKGAYWDTEIKRAQELGFDDYPVFTRKLATDVSYLACARRLLAAGEAFYPQFATHNAQTLAGIIELAGNRRAFEFQKSARHGRGALRRSESGQDLGIPCRVYAPVGSHEDLLPYLVRRLLENGANSSFVNRMLDPAVPIESWSRTRRCGSRAHRAQGQPDDPDRRRLSTAGAQELARHRPRRPGRARPARGPDRGRLRAGPGRRAVASRPAPSSRGRSTIRPIARREIGGVIEADAATVDARGGSGGSGAFPPGTRTPVETRAACSSAPPSSYEANAPDAPGLVRARGRQDPGRCRGRGPRGRRLPALLRGRGEQPGCRPASCRARPARATGSRCTAAACSPRSAPGIFRSRSSPARSRRRWRPAMR